MMIAVQYFALAPLSLALLCPFPSANAAAPPANPFYTIAQRNAFGLTPAPRNEWQPPPAPLPELTLNGITTITGKKLALLAVKFPHQPPQKPKEEFWILAEGQSEGPVEVLEVNVKIGTVKVNNSGTVVTLNFDKNGPKGPPAPPPARPGWPRFAGRLYP